MDTVSTRIHEIVAECSKTTDEKLSNFASALRRLDEQDDTKLLIALCDGLVDFHTYPAIVQRISETVRLLKIRLGTGKKEKKYCQAVTKTGSVCCEKRTDGGCGRYCARHSKRVPADDCVVCMEPLWKPIKSDCGHSLCEHCFVRWFIVEDHETCPTCRTSDNHNKTKYMSTRGALSISMTKKCESVDPTSDQKERVMLVYNIIHSVLTNNASMMLHNSTLYDAVSCKLEEYRMMYSSEYPKECRRLVKMFESYSEFRLKIM